MESFPALVVAVLVILSYAANSIVIVLASDPDPLQDICVADLESKVTANGYLCKDASTVTTEDFLLKGLDKAGDTSNQLGFAATPAFAMQLPGLNTLGISMARFDFAASGGLNPPHTHPRASEILVVTEGTLSVGFINTDNSLFSKTLEKGDVFVFPRGLVHFQQNIGSCNAVAMVAFNSQNPGYQGVASALFGASPPIAASVLARTFQIEDKLVKTLQHNFTSS
eukprot:PITA_18231